jgi:DNA-directed RNA polymerase omega subunit
MAVQMKAPQSQFAYVVLAARRARQLMAGAPPLVDNQRTQKATRIACEEVNQGLIEYDYTEPGEKEAEKDGKRKK